MCTLTKHLEIRPANRSAYDHLAQFHYRATCPAVCTAIYAIYDISGWHGQKRSVAMSSLEFSVGIIVYTMPAMELAARNSALSDLLADCRTRKNRLKFINQNIRCISRVIIDPRYRGLGLASRLVKETMPLQNVPIIEALAAMGRINPFFEKAGMTAWPAKIPPHCARMTDALKTVGINEKLFLRPQLVQKKLDALEGRLKFWLEHQMLKFLQAYGKRRNMPPGLDRTRFILSKLSAQPMYYIWVNRLACEARLSCDCNFSHV